MPWTKDDAYRHDHRADSQRKQVVWAKVANAARERELKLGSDSDAADRTAIREANAVVGRLS